MNFSALTLRIFLLTVVLAYPLEARAGWTTFDARDGLPVRPVLSIGEDPTGAIYAALENGQVWHQDWGGWRLFDSGPGENFNRNIGPRGRHVVRGSSTLFWVTIPFDNSEGIFISLYSLESQQTLGTVVTRAFHDMCSGSGDSLWVASGNSLTLVRPSRLLAHDPVPTISIPFPATPMWASTCLSDHTGRLWISAQLGSCLSGFQCAPGPTGVWALENGSWVHFDQNTGLASATVLGLFETTDGTVWAAHPGGMLSRFRNGAWSSEAVRDPCTGSPVEIIDWCATPAGGFWLLTSIGGGFERQLLQFQGERWSCLPSGLEPPAWASCLHVDDLNQLWVGTEMGTVSRLEPSYSRTLASAPYDKKFFVPAYQDRHGRLWGSLSSDSLYEFDGTTWRGAISDSGLAPVHSLLESSAGTLYAATPTGTQVLEDSAPWHRLPQLDVLGRPGLTALAERAPKQLYFLTLDGRLLENVGSTWTSLPTTGAGLINSSPGAPLLADSAGRIWAATDSGCAVLSNGNWNRFGASDGFDGQCIRILREGQQGDVWAASGCGDFRLLRYHAGSWRSYPQFVEVRQMVSDALGRIWIIAFAAKTGELVAGMFTNETWRQFGGGSEYLGEMQSPLAIRIDPTTGPTLTGSGGASLLVTARWREEMNYWGLSNLVLHSDSEGLVPYLGTRVLFVENDDAIWAEGQVDAGTKELVFAVPDIFPPQTELLNSIPPLVGTSRITASAIATRSSLGDVAFAFSADDERTPDPSMFSAAGVWQSPEFSDGHHAVRVWSRDQSRRVDPSPGIRFFEVDATAPAPRIASPGDGDAVSDTLTIVGRSYDRRYFRSELRIASFGEPPISGPDTLLAVLKTANRDTTIARFDTRTIPDGDYELRLSVTDSLGLIGTAITRVRIDNAFPPARLTVPGVRVHAVDGGDAYTNNGEVHLYFPPRALVTDSDVDIKLPPVSSILPELLPAIGLPQLVCDLKWSPDSLQKLAALEIAVAPGIARADSVLRLFHLRSDGGAPALVGGGLSTDQANRFLAPVSGGGTYVLALSPLQLPAATASTLDFRILGVTPRVLGRALTPGAGVLRIAFSLPTASDVSAEIYNRAGRLVRRIAIAHGFPAGDQVLTWDGLTEWGDRARDDVYLVSIRALGEQRQVVVSVARE